MAFSRRDFLKLGALTAASATTACSVIGQQIAANDLPEQLPTPAAETAVATTELPHPALRLLNRAGYGPRPGELERVIAMGLPAYLEEQLNAEAIDDAAVELLLRNLTLYHMELPTLIDQDERDGARELIGATIARALYSKRQLYEAMVEFWSDHFNIYIRKAEPMPLLKIADDRDVIRPHALGKFRDLLTASVHSPAMLVYLDNIRNSRRQPNENYARELLELHTLGVDAGYTQQDVQEVARILTGWQPRRRGLRAGQVVINPDEHDTGAKVVLGQTFPAGRGAEEITELIELLVTHPATAVFIATKLVRRFVADEPPPALVTRVADTFTSSDGDIKAMLRVIFLSEEFATAPMKLKRPFTYLVSTLRTLNATLNPDSRAGRAVAGWLQPMGQPLFLWPPPNGYPDSAAPWAANLLPRWNFALSLLHNSLPGTTVPLAELRANAAAETPRDGLNLASQLALGRPLSQDEWAIFANYLGTEASEVRLRDSIALLLASPAFQWT